MVDNMGEFNGSVCSAYKAQEPTRTSSRGFVKGACVAAVALVALIGLGVKANSCAKQRSLDDSFAKMEEQVVNAEQAEYALMNMPVVKIGPLRHGDTFGGITAYTTGNPQSTTSLYAHTFRLLNKDKPISSLGNLQQGETYLVPAAPKFGNFSRARVSDFF